ncbi:tautomerase family protein [Bosea sp. (in: a-proteobacteria)]|jgi:4-oxalocrotonate tautomerase|uniref:tautomerase family protein n=1 Tax=Bosea sp. (in: a-proteobacteria) TaxID=1871050 RepID=UPI002DDC8FF5|nr:tautomerase family protein [Bosea sp. (in: a-proteobacteria)]HEV2513239.1 tautomerase family protein [Bosea sp. (in: a-proteobacteria)]
MPFVSIKYVKENIADDPAGKQSRIADRIAEAISAEMGVGKDDVWVAFEGIAAAEFYVGPDSVATRRARRK